MGGDARAGAAAAGAGARRCGQQALDVGLARCRRAHGKRPDRGAGLGDGELLHPAAAAPRPAAAADAAPVRCQEHKEHISSLSITGYGPPGSKNVSSLQFNQALKGMGIDTYSLWGGDWSSFSTRPRSTAPSPS